MKWLVVAAIIILALFMLVLYSLMAISSRCSREEERQMWK